MSASLKRVQRKMGREVWKQRGRLFLRQFLFCFVLFFLKWDHRNRVAAGGSCEVSEGLDAGRNG